jgi:hypothetical protein
MKIVASTGMMYLPANLVAVGTPFNFDTTSVLTTRSRPLSALTSSKLRMQEISHPSKVIGFGPYAIFTIFLTIATITVVALWVDNR